MRIIVHLQYVNIYIDPRIAYTQVNCYPIGDVLERQEDETWVSVDRVVDIYKLRRFFGPLNCVEEAKSFIGMSKPFVFTPYQLYKEVIKDGQRS